MRKTSLDQIYQLAQQDERVIFIGSDLGPGVLSEFKTNIPERFFMEGISEQYIVGMAAGLRAYGFLNSNVLGQIKGSAFQIFNSDLPFFALASESIFNNFIILIGTITGLMYFYFSREHTGNFGKLSKLGIYFLMISFGASFGFAVMGRISLLIGRFVDLITYSGSAYNHATLWLLLVMILLLGYSAFFDKNSVSDNESAE